MDTESALIFTASAVGMLLAHRVGDYMVQTPHQATHKGLKGADSWEGRWNAAKHAATYTAVQIATVCTILGVLGFTGSWGVVAGALVLNGVTHYVIDRRWTLEWFARCILRKSPWIDADPGALPQLDQAAHLALFGPVALAICALA